MPIHRSASPVVEAIISILEILHPGQIARDVSDVGKQFLVLSYQESILPLWSFWKDDPGGPTSEGGVVEWISSGDEQRARRKRIILVWDGLPESPVVGSVNLSGYVTPYDWLVALALYKQAAGAGTNRTDGLDVQVLLIDLIKPSDGDLESALLFQQIQHGSRPAFPWVDVCHSAASPSNRVIENLISGIAEWSHRETSRGNGRPTADDRRTSLIRRIWGARLLAPSNPRDHHSIANLLGPHLLISVISPSNTFYKDRTPHCLFALLSLVRVLASGAVNHEQTAAGWSCLNLWEPLLRQGIEPTFILMDDMAGLGWSEFLCMSLGLKKDDQRLLIFNRPDSPAFGPSADSSLPGLLRDSEGRLRIRCGLDIHPSAKDPILFLDLRLFSQRTVNEEMSFFGELLELAKQARDDDPTLGLPWRGFSKQELESIGRCITQQKVENDDYFLALTLLPRLIALVDPLLPIILFSSTGQRRISEALKGYENIITDFDKPRFIADQIAEVIAATQNRFERAFTQAIRILKSRNFCLRVQNLKDTTQPRQSAYVEIYIDESGWISKDNFRVGGIVLIYDDEQQADDFNKMMVDRSLVFGPTDIRHMPTKVMPKWEVSLKTRERKVFMPIEDIANRLGIVGPIAFCLVSPPELKLTENSNQYDLTSPWCLDNVYRTLIFYALEVLLFEEIPRQLGQQVGEFRCSVYIATRVRARSEFDSQSDWCELPKRYGINWVRESGGERFVSLGSDDAYPIVAEVRKLGPEGGLNIVTARGATLKTELDNKKLGIERLPRPAHFLADLVARESVTPDWNNSVELRDQCLLEKYQPTLYEWLKRGLITFADAKFSSQLLACRHARFGRHLEAILEAYNAAYCYGSFSGFDRWARPRISQSVRVISGRSLAEMFMKADSLPESLLPGDLLSNDPF